MSNVNKIKVNDIVKRINDDYEGIRRGYLYKVISIYGYGNQDCDVSRNTNHMKRGVASDYFIPISDKLLIKHLRTHEYVEGISFDKKHVKIHGNLYHIRNDWLKIMDILYVFKFERTLFEL